MARLAPRALAAVAAGTAAALALALAARSCYCASCSSCSSCSCSCSSSCSSCSSCSCSCCSSCPSCSGCSAFVLPSAGARVLPRQAPRAPAAQQVPPPWASASACAAALASAAAAAVGMGLARRSGAAQRAVRRELAIAYEDSGIDLIDNGAFAQGLVGAEGMTAGTYEFDPVGFSKYTELVPFFREAELKHGRIAMLAWVGLVVPDFVRIPGERYSFEAIPTTLDAHDKLNGAVGVNFQILFWIAIVEFCCAKKVFEWNSLECAGDYGFGINFLPKDEEGQRRMRLAELKNARLAMIAFGGAVTQAAITRHPFPWL